MNNLKNWIENELYPAVFSRVDNVFPEHDFRRFSCGWRSRTYLDGTPHKNRKDKTVITKKRPKLILEQGGDVLNLIDYVKKRNNVNFITAVKILAETVNLQVPGLKSDFTVKHKANPYNPKPFKPPETVYFDFETFKNRLGNYDINGFIQNLLNRVPFPFETATIQRLIELYRLGTVANGYRKGAVCFPFIDLKNRVRTVQVKQFDRSNHTKSTDFLHSIIEKHHNRKNEPLPKWLKKYLKQEKRVSCLFGEHLLKKFPNNPVALAEDPKTAIICSLYFGFPEKPNDWLWLGVYNKSSFKFDKIKVLQGRFIYVFPDLSKTGNTFKEWKTKAEQFETKLTGTRFIFSDLLEKSAPETDRMNGNDMADFLIKLDWRHFQKTDGKEKETVTPTVNATATVQNNKPLRLNWRNYLKIPLETRCAIIKARNNGMTNRELYERFNVKTELIDLILNPS